MSWIEWENIDNLAKEIIFEKMEKLKIDQTQKSKDSLEQLL